MFFHFKNIQTTSLNIELNRSKSLFIRFLIGWFLKKQEILPVKENDAHDVHITERALQIIKKNQYYTNRTTLNIEDCGAAYRFFLALLSVTKGKWLLTGNERVLQRPILPLVESLSSIGAEIHATSEGFFIEGKELRAKKMNIDCHLSSQFASALLLISQEIGLEALRTIPEIPVSSSYIAMTRYVMNEIEKIDNNFSPESIESDWSSAAFWYGVMTLSQIEKLFIPNLWKKSIQGDRIVAEYFSLLGVHTTFLRTGIQLTRSEVHDATSALFFDIRQCLDLAPVLCCTCLLLKREVQLDGVENLNHKESKRLDVLIDTLSSFADIRLDNNTLHIYPTTEIKDKKFSFKSHKDHRFVMAFMLFSLYNEVYIDHTESVKKSYPDFFKDLQKLKY